MLGIFYLPIICLIIIGGSWMALKPIDFFTPKEADDPFDSLFH